MSRLENVALLARDPHWFPHRYDPGQDAVHLVRLDREQHRRASFLTEQYFPADAQTLVLGRAEMVAAAPPAAPLHFVFHSAFCCSTLVTRMLDLPGIAMGLREPMLLQDVVAWRRGGGAQARLPAVVASTLRLLARPFLPGEAIIAKPSNVVNSLAPAILQAAPATRALVLHAPLRTYLTSIAKQGLWGRTGVRQLLVALIKDGVPQFGFSSEQLLGQTDLQVAAVGWLMQQRLFATLATSFGPERVRTLDSETLLSRPEAAIRALAILFALPIDDQQAADIARGPALSRHSKSDIAYDAQARQSDYRNATAAHGDEIDKVAQWAEAIAATIGLSLFLPAPLLPADRPA